MKTTYQLPCVFCKTLTKTSRDINALLCGNCVAKLSGGVVETKIVKVNTESRQKVEKKVTGPYVPTGRPRGWHKKEHFEFNGIVYKYGKPVS